MAAEKYFQKQAKIAGLPRVDFFASMKFSPKW
jgi:hypothetical protein